LRWAAFLRTKDDPAVWDCAYCEEKGLQETRNCKGNLDGYCASHGTVKYEEIDFSESTGKPLCPECGRALKMPFEIVLGKKYRIFQCPLNEVDPYSLYLISLVNWSEATGQLPSGGTLFDETNWYYELREFVVTEQNTIRDEYFTEKEKQARQSHRQGSVTPKSLRRR
jgi:hypothetical protein